MDRNTEFDNNGNAKSSRTRCTCERCGKHIPGKIYGKRVILFCSEYCLDEYGADQSYVRSLRADD